MLCLAAQSCLTLCDPIDCSPPGSSVHGGSPGKDAGVGWHDLLQGAFPTQGSNPGLLRCRRILYHRSHQGSPRILEWAAYSFFRGSSRNWTGVSCTAGRFFTSWGIREALTVREMSNELWIFMLGCFSHVQLFGTPRTIACQVPLSMGFSR